MAASKSGSVTAPKKAAPAYRRVLLKLSGEALMGAQAIRHRGAAGGHDRR